MANRDNQIRVPRQTAMFVTGLAKIIRDHLELKVIQHEHWMFETAGEWILCGSPGMCRQHGMSDEYQAELREQGVDPEESWMPCYEHRMTRYLAFGECMIPGESRGQTVRVHAMIEHSRWAAGGDYYEAKVWSCDASRNVRRGAFWLNRGSEPMPKDEACPQLPTGRLAFWRAEEEDRTKMNRKRAEELVGKIFKVVTRENVIRSLERYEPDMVTIRGDFPHAKGSFAFVAEAPSRRIEGQRVRCSGRIHYDAAGKIVCEDLKVKILDGPQQWHFRATLEVFDAWRFEALKSVV